MDQESYKVVLLGESGVGKTSIITQFIDETFMEDQQSTNGATFSTKMVTCSNGKQIKFDIWDTAGQEKYRALTKMFYKDASAAILVYDITRQESFNELKTYWAEQIRDNSPKKIVLGVAANKSDLLEQEAVDEGEARAFAKEMNAIFNATSAKNQSGVEDLFVSIANKLNDPTWEVGKEGEEKKKIEKIKQGTMKLKKEEDTKEPHRKKGCC